MLLCSCAKDESVCVGRTVVLKAQTNTQASRANFDGTKSSWVVGDNLSVVFSASDCNYGPYNFTNSTNNVNLFRCDNISQDIAETCDVVAFHQPEVAVSDNNPEISIGSPIQTQEGDSSAHVAKYNPLYGVANNVTLDNISINMSHMASVMSFTLKNDTSAEMVISSVSISTSSGAILSKNCKFNLLDGSESEVEVSDNIRLSLTNATLAPEETIKAWVAVAPFELSSDDKIYFGVKTVDGKAYSYTKNLTKAVEFNAGKIMNLSDEISLGTDSQLVDSQSIVFDFESSDNVEPSLPKAPSALGGGNDSSSHDTTKIYSYTINGEQMFIKSDVPFYYYSVNKSLGFEFSSSENKYAWIYLPKCKFGVYKISEVVVTISSGVNNVEIAVTESDHPYGEEDNFKNASLSGDLKYSLSSTSATSQYYVCVWGYGSAKCKISKITIKYTL